MEQFRDRIIECIQYADSKQLAKVLSVRTNKDISIISKSTANVSQVFQRLPPAWISLIAAYINCLGPYLESDWKRLFTNYKEMFNCFLRIFQTGDASMLELLYVMSDELWYFGRQSGEDVEEATRLMNKTFTMCLTDRTNVDLQQSRRYGIYLVFAKLLKAYFEIGQYNLCKNAIRALGVSELPDISAVPKSHSVSFHYYLGKYYFLEEDYQKAEESFAFSLERCLPSFARHIQHILHYIIPIRLLKGHYPSILLLNSFSVDEIYLKLVEAVKAGNIHEFFQCMRRHHRLFLSLETYTCLEKCTFVVYRNLFCHIFNFNLKNTKIPFDVLLAGFQLSTKSAKSRDELEAMLVNVISKYLVKGYLSHDKGFLVLSQNDPFPRHIFQS